MLPTAVSLTMENLTELVGIEDFAMPDGPRCCSRSPDLVTFTVFWFGSSGAVAGVVGK
jgi:hypothetical protein